MFSFLHKHARSLVGILLPTLVLFVFHRVRIALAPTAMYFDPFLHFLGGASIAWVVWRGLSLLIRTQYLPKLPNPFVGIVAVSVTAFVGVLWEFYEYAVFIWINPAFDIRLPDTMGDLLLDISGALLLSVFMMVLSAKTNTSVASPSTPGISE